MLQCPDWIKSERERENYFIILGYVFGNTFLLYRNKLLIEHSENGKMNLFKFF